MVLGFGFRVQGFGFLGFRVAVYRFRALGSRASGLGLFGSPTPGNAY